MYTFVTVIVRLLLHLDLLTVSGFSFDVSYRVRSMLELGKSDAVLWSPLSVNSLEPIAVLVVV